MIEFNNQTKIKVDQKLLKQTAEVVLKKEGKGSANVSVVLLGAKKMRELNNRYRGKDYAANVLSFNEEEFGLGEIVLCPSVIRREAEKCGITFREELQRLFLHGLMHLLGYDHEGKEEEAQLMEQKEELYLSFFK